MRFKSFCFFFPCFSRWCKPIKRETLLAATNGTVCHKVPLGNTRRASWHFGALPGAQPCNDLLVIVCWYTTICFVRPCVMISFSRVAQLYETQSLKLFGTGPLRGSHIHSTIRVIYLFAFPLTHAGPTSITSLCADASTLRS